MKVDGSVKIITSTVLVIIFSLVIVGVLLYMRRARSSSKTTPLHTSFDNPKDIAKDSTSKIDHSRRRTREIDNRSEDVSDRSSCSNSSSIMPNTLGNNLDEMDQVVQTIRNNALNKANSRKLTRLAGSPNGLSRNIRIKKDFLRKHLEEGIFSQVNLKAKTYPRSMTVKHPGKKDILDSFKRALDEVYSKEEFYLNQNIECSFEVEKRVKNMLYINNEFLLLKEKDINNVENSQILSQLQFCNGVCSSTDYITTFTKRYVSSLFIKQNGLLKAVVRCINNFIAYGYINDSQRELAKYAIKRLVNYYELYHNACTDVEYRLLRDIGRLISGKERLAPLIESYLETMSDPSTSLNKDDFEKLISNVIDALNPVYTALESMMRCLTKLHPRHVKNVKSKTQFPRDLLAVLEDMDANDNVEDYGDNEFTFNTILWGDDFHEWLYAKAF